jgi:hypothetical protein
LPGLELGVCLVDDIKSATTLHDLASSVSALKGIERGENFHGSSGRGAHFTADQFSVKPILGCLFSHFGTLAVV